ncbi:MAG: ADOP family duplicated permease [Vicinamibacterales bacterium]|nr:ADOP family duplicated permease [Vicinamibacterales bacterium]
MNMTLLNDLRHAARSLSRVKGLAMTVVVTLALGIGANAAIFTVVQGVLLRPLVNEDEDRLIYIRHSAPGLDVENAAFSVPELRDLQAGVTSVSAFGDFSVIEFTMVGLGEPRVVRAGVVGGTYFEVMGLRPILGRLLGPSDDGPQADGAAVLTHRFWTSLGADPSLVGKRIRLGERAATIVGVLEPSVPYPSETEIVANVVTSPHHLDATMVDGRVHRMTELFGRLAPGVEVDTALAELRTAHAAMIASHPEAYPERGRFQLTAVRLRDQITAPARTVLLVLLAASALIFIIACSNVANLILARSVRREGELAIRAALGASRGALRRTLLAESLLLCGGGALLGVAIARPMVDVLARYASRFSVRALDLTVDASMLWVGVSLAMAAAVLLAFVPRLPSAEAANGLGLSGGGVRITTGTNRRLRVFAVTQIAASFVLLAGAGALVTALIALQTAPTGFNLSNVLALHVPISFDRPPEDSRVLYREIMRRVAELPGVERVAVGTAVPWRDAGVFGPGFQFSLEGYGKADGEEDPRARFRTVSPGFFASLGVPIIAGRDFNDDDRSGRESVVIVSESVARRMANVEDAVNRRVLWTDPVMAFIGIHTDGRRIVGVAADVDDENVVPGPAMTIYHPFEQEVGGGRLFVHALGDPYALVTPITRIIRDLAPDQPVERAATLEDVRAEVLAPDRLNALVFGGVAGVALMIAVVGVAGVLAFSVSARTREFGVRLAIGSEPRQLLVGVLSQGALIAGIGIVAGAIGGLVLVRLVSGFIQEVNVPGLLPVLGAATILVTAAVLASLIPAARAARVDVMTALRSD